MKHYLKFKFEPYYDSNHEIDLPHCVLTLDILSVAESRNFLNIQKLDYQPKIGDKIFLVPGVNIPRVKLKDLTLEYNIQTVRNIEDSNVVFAGPKSIEKLIDENWVYRISTESFKACVDALEYGLDTHYVNNVKTALEHYEHPYIYSEWKDINELIHEGHKAYTSMVQNPGLVARQTRSSDFLLVVDDEYIDLVNALEGKVVIDQATLIDKINSNPDALTIDHEVYEKLSEMFKSSDADNHVLAMELIANSNYKESLLYIEMLFKDYHNQISNSRTKNHVNFKSLLNYLGKGKYDFQSTLDSIVNSLISKGCLTEQALLVLLDKYSSEIANHGNRRWFKVKTVTLDEELLAKLNTNFIYSLREDYIPVKLEIEEEEKEAGNPEELVWM